MLFAPSLALCAFIGAICFFVAELLTRIKKRGCKPYIKFVILAIDVVWIYFYCMFIWGIIKNGK